MEPYKSEVDGSWFNSGNDVSKQSQQMSNLIAQKVDAIVINAASPTGLNGIIAQAAKRGILVVSFDNVVTSPDALKVNTDQFKFGVTGAEWLAKKIGGKGNVIMVTGVAGTHVDEERNKGAESVWAKNPGIKVINRYTGMWDSATAERNTASILPSLAEVDGIWCQGGTDGVLKAFISAKRKLPPTAGEGENGFRKFMLPQGYMGNKVEGISIGQPPFLVLVSLELARRVLQGKYPKKNVEIPFPFVTNETVKVGETVFPDCPTASSPISPTPAIMRQSNCASTPRSTAPRAAVRSTSTCPRRERRRSTPPAHKRRRSRRSRISKSFGGVHALEQASFSARFGEVHALVGENGAGKSTMIKILGGRLRADAGELRIKGATATLRSPLDAHKFGLRTVFQELTLLPGMSVSENLLLNHEPRGGLGLIDRRATDRKADALLAELGIHHIDPRALIEDISLAARQVVEIVRAISQEPDILLLDEPTSSLVEREAQWLFGHMRRLRDAGKCVIFTSHRWAEIVGVCTASASSAMAATSARSIPSTRTRRSP